MLLGRSFHCDVNQVNCQSNFDQGGNDELDLYAVDSALDVGRCKQGSARFITDGEFIVFENPIL